MAEALGLVTSIMQLVATAVAAQSYIRDFRKAPEEQRVLLAEMENLGPLLKELQSRIDDNHSSTGAGKTVLASLVVDHLETQFKNQNIGVACIYLDHKEAAIQTPSNLLASLWRQLVVGKTLSSLAAELYQKHSEKRTRPTLDETDAMLRSAVAEWSRVYIVVDALDEYPEEERDSLISHLTAISSTVRLLLTSRPHIILSASPTAEVLEIRAADEDIRKYIDERARKSPRLSMHVQRHPELRQEIELKIISTVDGMFLLAKLHTDSLATKSTLKALREALESLPKDLEHTYDEALARIDRQNEDDRKIAHSALTWVAHAKRVLSVAELREALAIEPGAKTLDPDNLLEINIILSVCAGLVIVDETTSAVRLVHYTTQVYLDSVQDRRFPEAQTEITVALLTYLTFESQYTLDRATTTTEGQGSEEDQYLTLLIDRTAPYVAKYPLLDYCQYCLAHAVGRPEIFLRDLIVPFLEQASSWPQSGMWHVPPWDFPEWPVDASPLWVAAAANLLGVAEYLLDCGISTSNAGRHGSTPLCVAAYYGHVQMIQLLLGKGMDANETTHGSRYSRIQNALQAASVGGSEDAVRLLIRNGANVNASDALPAASHWGREDVVRLLLECGADVNAVEGQSYGNSLIAASAQGHRGIVQMLLENGADMSARERKNNTNALEAASSYGQESVLLGWGADMNAMDETQGDSALTLAAMRGHVGVVDSLIAAGMDEILKSKSISDALPIVSFRGDEALVRLLLERGADANARNGTCGSAVKAAMAQGHDKIAWMLLEYGAEIDVSSRALVGTSGLGHEGVVRLLLDLGADVNAVSGECTTALQVASAWGNYDVARLLLERDADVNAGGGEYGSPLQAASMGKSQLTHAFSLDRGIPTEELHRASGKGYEAFVALLVAHGVDLSEQRAAKFVECVVQFETIHRMLVDNGADVNVLELDKLNNFIVGA
ncbi:ankyrin repeat-containing domain protein [Mycena maculata]|uniref:Ankyrin repeat-containing domain protein n=1 Tax=Mycena maculata TaxID=230809 RepID=A0AAD7HBQ8_9AGAR|nr:ankyrin repeat-containing domain protein [Mycena maculata]